MSTMKPVSTKTTCPVGWGSDGVMAYEEVVFSEEYSALPLLQIPNETFPSLCLAQSSLIPTVTAWLEFSPTYPSATLALPCWHTPYTIELWVLIYYQHRTWWNIKYFQGWNLFYLMDIRVGCSRIHADHIIRPPTNLLLNSWVASLCSEQPCYSWTFVTYAQNYSYETL